MPSIIAKNEPIAVIGSGCRFPGSASSPSKLWNLLSQPRDVLSEIPSTRFNPRGFYHPDGEYNGHSNVLHSYILDEDHRAWDSDFFNVSANEASAIDPQQRLLMECVYEALEAGGQRIRELRGSDTAVYVGLMCEEYSDIQQRELNTMPTVRTSNYFAHSSVCRLLTNVVFPNRHSKINCVQSNLIFF
jgi:hybrid polyketide synthase/nonribosomal peptide synthetase ACE1